MGALIEYGAILAAGAAAVLLLFLGVRAITRGIFGSDRRLERSIALEVLEGRLARGEISREEHDQARRALGG